MRTLFESEIRRNRGYDAAGMNMPMRLGALVIAACITAAPAWAAADKLVYKVDSVIATVSHSHIVIQVRGAVQSGGWKAAKLKLVHSDPHTIVVDFVAVPPPAGAPVIQGLLPVSAQTQVPIHRGVVAVRAVSDANEMTTQILK